MEGFTGDLYVDACLLTHSRFAAGGQEAAHDELIQLLLVSIPVAFACAVLGGVDGRMGFVVVAPIGRRLPHGTIQNFLRMCTPSRVTGLL